jgi:hypothetical protein
VKHYILIALLSFSNIQRWILTSLLLFFMVFTWWFYTAKTYQNRSVVAQQAYKAYQQEYNLLQTSLQKREYLKHEAFYLKERYALIAKNYEQTLSELISKILFCADEFGCTIESIKPSAYEKKEWFSYQSCEIQIIAPYYEQLKKFLRCLENGNFLTQKCFITRSKYLLRCHYQGKLLLIH